MSQVYSTEPQTTGRVILNTTHGPIDINLFCKESPTTCRSFLQLCLDGFYDDLIFHRILDNFLIQVGERESERDNVHVNDNDTDAGNYDAKANANIGSSDDLTRKKLEVIPRIKFNHRGQVAMALPLDQEDHDNDDDDNDDDDITRTSRSLSLSRQFFITMDEAPFLDQKYVIFGTVRGDTIFNALRIGKTETIGETGDVADKDNAPKIVSVRIVEHMFEDLVATAEERVPWNRSNGGGIRGEQQSEASILKKKRKKRKGKRDLNVLSFGGEMEDMDDGLDYSIGIGIGTRSGSGSGVGMNSSHDALHPKSDRKSGKDGIKGTGTIHVTNNTEASSSGDSKRIKEDSHSRTQSDEMQHVDVPVEEDRDTLKAAPPTSSLEHDPFRANTITIPNANAHAHAIPNAHANAKTAVHKEPHTASSNGKLPRDEDAGTDATPQSKAPKIKMSALEARRLKYMNRKSKSTTQTGVTTQTDVRKLTKQHRDDDTMSKLNQFKTKMFQAKGFKEGAGIQRNGNGSRNGNGNGSRNDNGSGNESARNTAGDDSLATRMARKDNAANQRKLPFEHAPVYSGQVLEDIDIDDSAKWMESTFKCRRHIDHDSKAQAMGGGGGGGDGRNIEDYEVIDSKRKRSRNTF
jgi:peptidyl-prolyl cis-trans isomerase SDCCAG10